jgi:exopolysaccharide production protein ExoZ
VRIRHEIVNVQALRACAALLVAVGHGLTRPGTAPPWFGLHIAYFAYAGVDVFFVISGFIVSQAACRAGEQVGVDGRCGGAFRFASRRIFRIYPLFWIVLALAIMLGEWIHIAPPQWPTPSLLSIATLTTIWITPLSSAWSLVFEVYFYFILTIIIFVAGRRVNAAIGCWMILQILWIFWPKSGSTNWGVSADPLVLEFGAGWLVSLLSTATKIRFPWIAIALALPFWITGSWLTAHQGLLVSLPRFETFGIGSALLVYGVIGLEADGYRAPNWIRRIGDVSYSIYLWHLVIFGVIYTAFPASGYGEFLATLGLIVGWSFLSYYVIERSSIRLGSTITYKALSLATRLLPMIARRTWSATER